MTISMDVSGLKFSQESGMMLIEAMHRMQAELASTNSRQAKLAAVLDLGTLALRLNVGAIEEEDETTRRGAQNILNTTFAMMMMQAIITVLNDEMKGLGR